MPQVTAGGRRRRDLFEQHLNNMGESREALRRPSAWRCWPALDVSSPVWPGPEGGFPSGELEGAGVREGGLQEGRIDWGCREVGATQGWVGCRLCQPSCPSLDSLTRWPRKKEPQGTGIG